MHLSRRHFLGSLLAAAPAMLLDPERLAWVPGQRTFFLPSSRAAVCVSLADVGRETLRQIRERVGHLGLPAPLGPSPLALDGPNTLFGVDSRLRGAISPVIDIQPIAARLAAQLQREPLSQCYDLAMPGVGVESCRVSDGELSLRVMSLYLIELDANMLRIDYSGMTA